MMLKDIVVEIRNREPSVSKRRIEKIINTLLDIIVEELIAGREIYLRRLGRIYAKSRKWHFHDKRSKWNPFDDKHRRGVSRAPYFRFSKHIKRALKK